MTRTTFRAGARVDARQLAWAAAMALASLTLAAGCRDSGKISETHAIEHADRLAKLAAEDVAEIRRGLPEGAASLAKVFRGDHGEPIKDAFELSRALNATRENVRDLMVAKSTFFILADPHGVVLRSDQDPDGLAGKTIFDTFHDLSGIAEGNAVETTGTMAELKGAKTGDDLVWITGVPVRSAGEPRVLGAYITGWSMRRFAYHLEDTVRREATIEAQKRSDKTPLVYAFAFLGAKVYGAPVTPLIDTQALEKLDLGKLVNGEGSYHEALEIEGRSFGLAARGVPQLGQGAGVAVLRSEI